MTDIPWLLYKKYKTTCIKKRTKEIKMKRKFSIAEKDNLLSLGYFHRGYAPFETNSHMIGLLNPEGRIVLQNGYSCLIYSGFADRWIYEDTMGYGVCNPQGDTVIPGEYDSMYPLSDRIFCISHSHKRLCGCVDIDNRLIVPPIYEAITPIHNGMFIVCNSSCKQGLINEQGEIIAPCIYDKVYANIDDPVLPLAQNGKSVFIYRWQGNNLLQTAFHEVNPFSGRNYTEFTVIKRGKTRMGLMDRDGSIVIPPNYDELEYDETDGLIVAYRQSTYCILNLHNVQIVPYSRFIQRAIPGKFIIAHRYRYELVDCEKRPIISPKYRWLRYLDSRMLFARDLQNREGALSLSGEEIIPFRYDCLGPNICSSIYVWSWRNRDVPIIPNWIPATLHGEHFYIDEHGERVLL